VTDAAVYVVLALGLNIVVGYAGLLDLGYAAFLPLAPIPLASLPGPGMG
jgi:branched-chain amino acid transport system permease protein